MSEMDWSDIVHFNSNTNTRNCPFISINIKNGSICISSSFWKLLSYEYKTHDLYYRLSYSKKNNAILLYIKVAEGFDCKKLRTTVPITSFIKQLKIVDCPNGRFVPQKSIVNGEDCWIVYLNNVIKSSCD